MNINFFNNWVMNKKIKQPLLSKYNKNSSYNIYSNYIASDRYSLEYIINEELYL